MCAAVDMLASQHYFYGHSPPAGFLSEYGLPSPPPVRRPPVARGRSAPCLTPQIKTIQLNFRATPRSILRAEADKAKKRVAFADDRGYALEQVRFMTEPSHVPPYWMIKVIPSPEKPVAKAAKEPELAERPVADRWECRFAQPASDYVGFRRRITDENVSLENVIVKESESVVDGTVKVKNLDFGKEVLVRTTADGWRTHEDTFCAFSDCGPSNGAVSIYDTFAFRLQLPNHSRRLEFCVCFSCKGEEFWDSNGGQNYIIERRSVRAVASPASFCGRVNSGNSWSARSDTAGNTPYW